MNKKLIILGNGPSLKGVDLKSFSNIDTLGMNAAYRYWERIDWYPTHYVCLDDQLIETHADAIYDLIVNEKVKTAFLIAKILNFHPDLLNYENVFYLESFHGVRQKRVADKGIKYIKSMPFNESDPSKVTTGAYAVRFGAHLGYKQISILGVDLRYVEIIPEAKNVEGIKLVMKSTPKSNPNYFFDDYQQAGDKYNIPNPASHGRNLHISAFENLANDVVQFGWSAKIVNSNKKSVLYDKATFPYVEINNFLRKRKLSALVVPCTPKEVTQIENNMRVWDKPLLSPSIYQTMTGKPDLVFAFSCAEDSKLTRRVLELFNKTKYVNLCFEKIEIIYVSLDKSLDYYEKDYSKKINGRGYKSGPNEQFFELMRRLSYYENFIFYMETDCVPLRQGWLDEVRVLAEGDNESWVIGSYYRGQEKISDMFSVHLNGNALYRVGDPEFTTFVENFWRPQLYKILDTKDKRMAYDCFLSYFMAAASPQIQNFEWKMLQEIGHRFRATSVIQNISGRADAQQDPCELVRGLLTDSSSTFVVHGLPFQKLLNETLQKIGINEQSPFYWGEIIGEKMVNNDRLEHSWQVAEAALSLRLLMIDSTPIGHGSATGQLKKTFLGNWPKENFLQIWETGGANSDLKSIKLGQSINDSRKEKLSIKQVIQLCEKFQPDVIYFRPVDSEVLFAVVEQIVDHINKPIVVHMMDDWPERLKSTDMSKYQRLDAALRHFIRKASLRLSICDAMSDAYQTRYGVEWLPLANGVDWAESPSKDWSKRPPVDEQSPFLIRYMGALADDMTYSSVRDIATVVSNMQSTHMVRFEIYTMDWCRSKAEKDIGKWSGVSIHPLVENRKYKQSLAEADALVIAYNFDPKSISYIGLSLANKMPECLASGVPLLAYGSLEVATIRYLKEVSCAQVVEHRDERLLTNSIKALVNDLKLCQQLGEKGRVHTAEKLSKQIVQDKFRNHIYTASKLRGKKGVMPVTELGSFRRNQHAHYDETDCIAELYKESLYGKTMIDVGAHHGWAHAPFLERDWCIYAFEPDNQNRAKLLERLAKHRNKHLVTLDSCGVSNKPQKGVSFFTSEQSTGISGLSAFHETHEESQKVDITTLTEFFQGKEMPDVDFLKIDTEGHDLFVLQGFPWGRGKPAVIECEFEDSKTIPLGYTFHDLARFLTEKGYTVYVSEWHPIIRYGVRHDWRQLMRYPCELADPKGWGNLMAFREPLDEDKLITAINKVITVGHEPSTISKVKNTSPLPIPEGKYLGFNLYKDNTKHFTYISSTKWHYHHSSSKQRLWIASINIKQSKGLTFDGGITLQADDAITISISLGRSGNSSYEGSAKKVKLKPKVKQYIKLRKTFSHEHSGLKLQLDILDTEKEMTTLMIEDLYIHESLENIEKSLGKENITLSKANELMRKGDYQSAKSIYSLLERKSPLRMYAENIKLAEYKLISQNNSYRNVK